MLARERARALQRANDEQAQEIRRLTAAFEAQHQLRKRDGKTACKENEQVAKQLRKPEAGGQARESLPRLLAP